MSQTSRCGNPVGDGSERCRKKSARRAVRVTMLMALFLAFQSFPSTAEQLVIGTSYKSLLSTPQQDGMLDRIVKEAFRRIGREVEIPFQPAERSIIHANRGIHDGELNRIAGMEALYPNLLKVPEPTMTMQFVLFQRADAPPIDSSEWTNLRPHQIGFVKGWKILEKHTQGFPHLTKVNSAKQLFRILSKDRVDGALYARLLGQSVIHDMGLSGIRASTPALAAREMFLYINRKHAAMVPQLAEALRAMKHDGTYQHIVDEALAPFLQPDT